MKRSTLLPVAAALSAVALTGCSTMQFPAGQLPEPRPSYADVKTPSKALQIATAIKTTQGCLGCADTLLWEDEAHLSNQVGFDPVETQEKWRDERQRLRREGKAPPAPNPSNPGVDPFAGWIVADSLDGTWRTAPSWGMGLGFMAAIWLLSPSGESEVDYGPTTRFFKFAYVFPKSKKVRVKGFEPDSGKTEEEHARLYAAQAFVNVAAKTAEDFGFKPIGPLRVNYLRNNNGFLDWNYIWQPLENDALSCPKVTDDLDRYDMCRVEWSPYGLLGQSVKLFWQFEEGVIPKVLGGDGKTTGWMAHFGYDHLDPGPLFIDEADNVQNENKLLHDFALGMQKHMKKGMFAYIPAFEINGMYTPQVVMDKSGVHYFSVIMPRKPEAKKPAK